MTVRLEEYNKNQRVYHRGKQFEREETEDRSSDYQSETENKGKAKSSEIEFSASAIHKRKAAYAQNAAEPSVYRRNQQESKDFSYINTESANPYDESQYMEDMRRINLAGRRVKRTKTPSISKGKNGWKYKLIYCFIIAAIFILTPYVLTILITGKVGSQISDTLTEARRVNVEYKGGSQAMDASKYLIGIVASEYNFSNHPEVLKLESILARTAVYKSMGDNMTVNSTDIPLKYLSEKEMKNLWGEAYEANYNAIAEAVSATNGMVLKYNGQFIEPLFHEVSAGKTRNASVDFSNESKDYSYMPSVVCEHDVESPDYLAVKNFTYEEFTKAIKQKYSDITLSKENPVDALQIVSRDSADYVLKVQLGTREISGEEFSNALGLNSSCFSIDNSQNLIKITTKGKGNGFGVSLYTAQNMADSGKKTEEIIQYFFPQTVIETQS